MKRRQFLSGSVAVGAGLVLGVCWFPLREAAPRRRKGVPVNPQEGKRVYGFRTTQTPLRLLLKCLGPVPLP